MKKQQITTHQLPTAILSRIMYFVPEISTDSLMHTQLLNNKLMPNVFIIVKKK